jgi:hypothetical protein
MHHTARQGALIMALVGLIGQTSLAQDSTKKPAPTPGKTATKKSAPATKPKPKPAATDSSPLWPVANAPTPLPGALLPANRIVAYYGNPLSKRMGILGEVDSATMLARLDSEVAKWNKADPDHPVKPALHLIAVVASDQPGTAGKYRTRMDSAMIRRVYNWAKSRNALLFLDVQVGQGTLQEELPRLLPWLRNPDIHLGIDPEFSMKGKHVPGTRIGTYDAADVNYASSLLQELVTKEKIPPKVLVVHRFTRPMLTGHDRIKLDPRVQIVINMDGWGPPSQKRESYRAYVQRYPVEYTGFKLFYHNDERKKGSRMMTPAEVLALFPKPLYIQYQ